MYVITQFNILLVYTGGIVVNLSQAYTVWIFFRIVLVRLYGHDDHVTLWDLLSLMYDSQDELKTGARRVLHDQPKHVQWLGTALHAGLKCWLSWKVYERRGYRRI